MAKKSNPWPWIFGIFLIIMIVIGVRMYLKEIDTNNGGNTEYVPFKVEFSLKDYYTADAISNGKIYIYDENMNLLETIVSDSGGKAVSDGDYVPGTVLKVQAKADNYYMSDIYTFTVPRTTEYRTSVFLGTIKLHRISTSINMLAYSGSNSLDNNTTTEISVTDTFSVVLTIQNLDDDSTYGASYYDYSAGKQYVGPILVLSMSAYDIAGLTTQADKTVSVGGTTYYIWYLDPIMNDGDDASDGSLSVNIGFEGLTNGTVTFTFSIYDVVYMSALESGQFGTADATVYDAFSVTVVS